MAKIRFVPLIVIAMLVVGCMPEKSRNRPLQALVKEDFELTFLLPEGGWLFTRQAPEALVRQMTGHLREEAASSGVELNAPQLEQLARKRLAANEGFVFNPQSGANLMIDFRSLAPGESIPDKKGLIGSAYGAELALTNEAGVEGVSSKISRMRISGSRLAYRTDIRYRRHGSSRKFVGIIGCTASHRFYLYYNDPLRDSLNAEQMEELFGSVTLRSGPGR